MNGLNGDSGTHGGVAKVDPLHHPQTLFLQHERASASARPLMI